MTHGKTHNKSPHRISHKATKSKTNTGTTALERSVEQTTGGFKALLQLANFSRYLTLRCVDKSYHLPVALCRQAVSYSTMDEQIKREQMHVSRKYIQSIKYAASSTEYMG